MDFPRRNNMISGQKSFGYKEFPRESRQLSLHGSPFRCAGGSKESVQLEGIFPRWERLDLMKPVARSR